MDEDKQETNLKQPLLEKTKNDPEISTKYNNLIQNNKKKEPKPQFDSKYQKCFMQ
jgi:hypothetical protein